jgi:hypothetical protein
MFAQDRALTASDLPLSHDVAKAIERMKSLHDSDRGFADVLGLGFCAVPALRSLLWQREPSGLCRTRRLAVEALAALKAYEVLAEFLQLDRKIDDLVERLGEDAVLNAAARGIARSRADWVFDLLLDLAERRIMSGVIAGLGSFGRKEAIPRLIEALAEDEVRMTAEAALREIGGTARVPLVEAAKPQESDGGPESESNLRKRRSVLSLLIDIEISRKEWPELRNLMLDRDTQIAFLACKLALRRDETAERSHAISRLADLRGSAHWLERLEIDRHLREFARKRRR